MMLREPLHSNPTALTHLKRQKANLKIEEFFIYHVEERYTFRTAKLSGEKIFASCDIVKVFATEYFRIVATVCPVNISKDIL